MPTAVSEPEIDTPAANAPALIDPPAWHEIESDPRWRSMPEDAKWGAIQAWGKDVMAFRRAQPDFDPSEAVRMTDFINGKMDSIFVGTAKTRAAMGDLKVAESLQPTPMPPLSGSITGNTPEFRADMAMERASKSPQDPFLESPLPTTREGQIAEALYRKPDLKPALELWDAQRAAVTKKAEDQRNAVDAPDAGGYGTLLKRSFASGSIKLLEGIQRNTGMMHSQLPSNIAKTQAQQMAIDAQSDALEKLGVNYDEMPPPSYALIGDTNKEEALRTWYAVETGKWLPSVPEEVKGQVPAFNSLDEYAEKVLMGEKDREREKAMRESAWFKEDIAEGGKMRERANDLADFRNNNIRESMPVRKDVEGSITGQALSSIAENAPSLVASLVARSAGPGMLGGWLLNNAEVYDNVVSRLRKEGKLSEEQISNIAQNNAFWTALAMQPAESLEAMIPVKAMSDFRSVAKKAGVFSGEAAKTAGKTVAKAMVVEGTTEPIQTAIQGVGENVSPAQQKSAGTIAEEAIASAPVGALAGGMQSSAGVIAGTVGRKDADPPQVVAPSPDGAASVAAAEAVVAESEAEVATEPVPEPSPDSTQEATPSTPEVKAEAPVEAKEAEPAPPAKEPEPMPAPKVERSERDVIRALIKPGALVEVSLKPGAKKVHKARIRQISEDQVQVRFEKSTTFKGGETQFVKMSQVNVPKGAANRALNEMQFDGMTPEEKKLTKAGALEFKQLVVDHPELGFYEPDFAGLQGRSAEINDAARRKEGVVAAMVELGANKDSAHGDDAITQAALLPKLKELVAKKNKEYEAARAKEAEEEAAADAALDAWDAETSAPEPVATPKLRAGENQGDLLAGSKDDPFNLAGEQLNPSVSSPEPKAPPIAKMVEDSIRAYGSSEKAIDSLNRQLSGDMSAEQKARARMTIAALKREASEPFAKGGARLPSVVASAPSPGPVKGIRQIITDLSKGLELPIRFGRLTTSKYAGYFKKVQNLIGAKTANDLPTVAHEAGHKLDAVFDLSSNPGVEAELMVLGDPATPGSRSSWTKSKSKAYQRGEGVGEFVRYWLIEPAKANASAPATAKLFESILDANPDFADVMRQSQADIQAWRNAPSEARLDSSIVVGGNPNGTRYGFTHLTRDLVDDLHVLNLVVDDATKLGGPLNPSSDPYKLARLLRGAYGSASSFIHRGVADFKTKNVTLGTSLEDALKPIAGRVVEFRRWIVAKRAQELMAQGKETGLLPGDVDFVANKYAGDADFQKAFDDIKTWQDSLLQYAVDAGYVSQDAAEAMRKLHQDYVPFHRLFEIGAGESPTDSTSGSGRGLNVGKVASMKRLTGSARDIVDPLETMVRNVYAIITASEKNAVSAAIADLADKPGMGKWVEKIRTPMEAVKVNLEDVRKQLENAGADLTGVPDDLLMTFFHASSKAPFGENIIKVTRDGKTTFYRLKSDLYQAFHALDMDDSGTLVRIMSAPAQLLRAGVTLDPAFALANVMRDNLGSAVINRHGMLPFEAMVRGAVAAIRNPKLVAEWMASGGEQSFEATFYDQKKMAAFMREKITKDLTASERALIVMKSPLTILRAIGGASEAVTRIGEYERAYKAAKKAGLSEGDAKRQAAFEARDRQDFAKGGSKTKILRHMAAFWNAGVQANVSILKAFRNRPIRSTIQGMLYITVPTIALMKVNWDDEDYWDRPQWERDGFWLIPFAKDNLGHTRFLRIPKPFILGVLFGTLPERAMAKARGEKEPFKGAFGLATQEVVPNLMPQTAQVLYANFFAGKQGWDTWRGRPIVPDSIADLPATLQWTEQTSLTARKMGGLIGLSPMKVDNIINGLTGGLGKHIVNQGLDRIIEKATGDKRTARNTMPGARFITTPAGITSESVTRFYDALALVREKYAERKMTGENIVDDDYRLFLEQTSKNIAELRKEMRATRGDKEKQRIALEIADLAKAALDDDYTEPAKQPTAP